MTTIAVTDAPALAPLLARADDGLVLAHRLSEWCGHAPMLEEELALANIALDLLGQARSLYARAAEVDGQGRREDDLAYLRDAPQFRNLLMLELPNGDFAFTIARLFLFSAYMHPYWRQAQDAADPVFAAVAAKAEKEAAYHLRHAAEWLIRLGDGTEESHRRSADALEALWPYTGEMLEDSALQAAWEATVARVLEQATLARPKDGWMQSGGRRGVHTEHLGHMLAVMQHLQRAYPGATW
jgi:ring-1,2-phenylacetyl-CoA epoxidase subunit PaaC